MPRTTPTLARTALAFAGVAVVALALWWRPDSSPKQEFASWHLPSDLGERRRVEQLQELHLSGDVDHLRWLRDARALRHVTLSSTHVTSLSGLPGTLSVLEVENQPKTDLTLLPPGLTRLRVAGSRLPSLPDLTGVAASSIKSLRLEGEIGATPLRLPADLASLALVDSGRAPDLAALPRGLRRLELSRQDLGQLDGWPPSLEAVQLADLGITDLAALPHTVRTLSLRANPNLVLDELPDLLVELTLEDQDSVDAELPSGLSSLTLVATGLESADLLPEKLKRLTLRDAGNRFDLSALIRHLPTLRGLYLDARPFDDLQAAATDCTQSALPELRVESLEIFAPPCRIEASPGLRSLRLESFRRLHLVGDTGEVTALGLESWSLDSVELGLGGEDEVDMAELLTGFPSLRELSLGGSRGDRLPLLPAGLESLDLSESSWQRVDLPPGLLRLSLRRSEIAVLPALPETLRSLDLSGTPIELEGLPPLPALEELTIHVGQLKTLGESVPRLKVLRVLPTPIF